MAHDAQDTEMVVVRMYLSRDPESLLKRLREWGRIRGATVVEGVRGFGGGEDQSRPVILEFFETPERAREVLEFLKTADHGGHVLHWPAHLQG